MPRKLRKITTTKASWTRAKSPASSSASPIAPTTTSEPGPLPKAGPPEDLSRILRESARTLREGDGPPRRRGPGRPRKDEDAGGAPELAQPAAPGATVAPPPPLPDEAAIQETTGYILDGCDFAAKETGYEGFKAKEPEARTLAKRLERVAALYTDRFNGPTAVWTFAIVSATVFVGKRYLGFKRYSLEQYMKANPDARGPEAAQAEAGGAPSNGIQA